jgi:hypothetical protein
MVHLPPESGKNPDPDGVPVPPRCCMSLFRLATGSTSSSQGRQPCTPCHFAPSFMRCRRTILESGPRRASRTAAHPTLVPSHPWASQMKASPSATPRYWQPHASRCPNAPPCPPPPSAPLPLHISHRRTIRPALGVGKHLSSPPKALQKTPKRTGNLPRCSPTLVNSARLSRTSLGASRRPSPRHSSARCSAPS